MAGTITAHHLFLIVDDWANDPINYCKPVAKLPRDRETLVRTALSGNPKFFLGTDSAPHSLQAKKGGAGLTEKCAAGVFTQPYATQLVLEAFDSAVEKSLTPRKDVTETIVRGFLGEHGRKFYGEPESKSKIKVEKTGETVVEMFRIGGGNDSVVPFRRNQPIYSLYWI